MSAPLPAVMRSVLEPLGVLVATKVPAPRPARMIRIVDAGGPEITDQVIDWAAVTWEAWAPTETEAEALAQQVRDLINAAHGPHGGGFVTSASSTRPRAFPDEITSTPRYVGSARVLLQVG